MKGNRFSGIKPLTSQLVVRIMEYLRRGSIPEGGHLVEQSLADTLHVSRSPVRRALLLLEREGIVLFHPNRGFFLAQSAEKIPNLNIEIPAPPEEEKYFRIAEDRIQGKLQGHVSEAELISRYGISRVKLMRVLMRMSQEGWVERRPGHGWNFLPVLETAEALDQGYRFRLLIEPAAVLEPTYRVDPVLFARLRQEQEAMFVSPLDNRTSFRMFETGARFHEQIVSCSGNRFFIEAMQNINRLRRLIEYRVKVDETRITAFQEHIEILTMLEQGKRTTASAMLRDHIDQTRIKKTTRPESQV
jgi:DNA-binding GntR family transcriptional regulator